MPNWLKILSFGQELLDLDSVMEQVQYVQASAAEWFKCQSLIWLNEVEIASLGEVLPTAIFGDTSLLNSDHRILQAAHSQEPFYTSDERLVPSLENACMASFPLKVQNRELGVLIVKRLTDQPFTKRELNLLRGLAAQSATAIMMKCQISSASKRLEHLSIITEVSRSISSILDLEQLLKDFIHLLHERLHYRGIHIFELHLGRKKLIYQAGDHPNPEGLVLDLDSADGLVPAAARLKKTLSTNDQAAAASSVSSQGEVDSPVLSEIALPLLFGNSVLGVLNIQSDRKNVFSVEEINLLEALADNLAVVMRNAHLYRSETWRRQVADSIREVAIQLTSGSDFESSLNLILSELQKILPCDYSAIWLVNNEGELSPDAQTGRPKLAVESVYLAPIYQKTSSNPSSDGFTPEEIIDICNQSKIPNSWLEEVLLKNQPAIREPGHVYETLGAILNFPEDYSTVAAPLVITDHPLGILVLGHHSPGRYGQEAQTMTETFASYAAVAIESSRLLEAAHDQAWLSTVLLQVAEATQSTQSLEELLNTVVNITPTLIGIDVCMIFVWDNLSRAFFPMAERGLDEDQQDVFSHCVIAEDEHPVFNRLLTSGKVAFYHSDEILQQVEISHLFDILVSINLEKMDLAFFPMSAHGEFLGALVINYHQLLKDDLVLTEVSNLPENLEEKFSIIQGIAHQTSIAAENIQLIKAQREEAYVSVALLQVAQAVSSTNSLAEILESIVRLTPILTGIIRCVIFLWDDDSHLFFRSQSYGITKTELTDLQTSYRPEEYHLLEIVRRTSAFAYHEVNGQNFTPNDWDKLQQPEIVLHFENHTEENPAADGGFLLDTSKNFLKSIHPLLMAYPLTIKGSVLGVILFEEPSSSNIPVSRNIREKRHEISVGITQQAALAIQNDLFQKEIVIQERMERELQLAREIQQTFLPDKQPLLTGWDLEARWQPAREVGGDFYDFYELPGNRLGIVIADVADKGMPAALFMTLSRTLLRSSARENPSPAAVLNLVNDLIVSDTKRSLFVTVVYGILSLETGEFLYANAGHNYPILFDESERELQLLTTTGMALGVLPEISVIENRIMIAPGDSLILYTDGITEAFSETGEMFGEARLHNAIRRCIATSAKEIATCIEENLGRFVANAPLSDDVTLITLKREA